MMKRFKVFKKLCSLALILSMLVSMIPVNVFAAPTIDDITKKGSLTINKYDSNYILDNPDTSDKNEEVKILIDDVEFTIYKIYDVVLKDGVITYTPVERLNNFLKNENPELIAEKSKDDLKKFISSLKTEIEKLKDNDIAKYSVVTGANGTKGQAVFSNLDLGYYLVDETAYPDQVVTPSDAFLVSIPMTNEAEDSWVYDIVANPKNDTALTDITLIKYGIEYDIDGKENKGTLPGAEFQLQKFNGNDWVCHKSTEDDEESTVADEGSTEQCTKFITDANGEIKVDGLTQGKYRFIEISAPDGYIAKTFNKVTDEYKYDFEVVYNKSSKQLEFKYQEDGKTVQKPTYTIKVDNEKPTMKKEADKETAGLGETVRWTVETTVPSLINELKTFTITDTLTNGLKFSEDINLEVLQGQNLDSDEVESDVIELNDFEAINNFKFEENLNTIYVWGVVGKQLMIRFNPLKLTPSENIIVSYDTEITSDAVIFPSGNENKAKLEYSISTSPNSTTGTIEDEDVVYSFGLQVNKTASDETTMLGGAKFTLEFLNEQGQTVKYYTETTPDKTPDGNDDPNKGIIQFPQLAAGSYRLTEVQAPNGYNLLKEPITITIGEPQPTGTENKLAASVTATINGKTTSLNQNSSNYYELTVVNNNGFTLPETGGMGTVIFTVAGLGMMGLAGAAYIALKRKESQQ